MFEQILQMATSQLGNQMAGNSEIPQNDIQNIASTAGSSIFSTISNELMSGNMSGISEMLSGSQTTGSNPIVNSISQNVVGSLIEKCGLNHGVATSVASMAVPFIMNMFNDKVSNAQNQQGGFDVAGLVSGALSGGGQQGGGLIGNLLGGILGGNKANNSSSMGQQVLGSILGQLMK